VKFHVVADSREAHQGERGLLLANAKLRKSPRDEDFAVADPTRERLGEICPPLMLRVVFRVRNAAGVEPGRFGIKAQMAGVCRRECLN
jgi:hypothetical protein